MSHISFTKFLAFSETVKIFIEKYSRLVYTFEKISLYKGYYLNRSYGVEKNHFLSIIRLQNKEVSLALVEIHVLLIVLTNNNIVKLLH